MGILDRFKKVDLDLDIEEDELLKEALGYKPRRKSKAKRSRKKTARKVKSSHKTRKSSKKRNNPHKKITTSKSEHGRTRELERDVRTLTKKLDKLTKENSKLKENQRQDIRHLREEIRAIETAVNPKQIHKMIANLSLASKKIRTMEREDNTTLNTLHRIDRRISNIEKRAIEVEGDYRHAKTSADGLQKKSEDLKHTASVFMRQMDHFHSKTNVGFNKLVDMEKDLYEVRQRLAQIEDVKLNSNAMENTIAQQSRTLSELARKLEYIERTASRTIVLD